MKVSFFAVMTSIAIVACSGSDDASVMRPRGGETNGSSTTTNATQPKDDGEEVETKSNSDQDPSTSTPPASSSDAGVDAAKPIDPNPFAGAAAYVNTLGPSARKTAHPFTNDNPAGKACFNCHGGNGAATPMAFGGTVYTTAAGTTAAARVEVRMKDKDGKAISAWSDADGNFYFFVDPNGDLNLPGHAGIRNAKGTKLMTGTLSNGNCNSCHNANNAGRLVAPQ